MFTEAHQQKLQAWLRKLVWKDFKTEGSELYQVGLAEVLEALDVDEEGVDEGADDAKKATAKGKAKPKGKAKGKTKGKAKAKGSMDTAVSKAIKQAVAKQKKADAEDGESQPEDSADEEVEG